MEIIDCFTSEMMADSTISLSLMVEPPQGVGPVF